jgi:hypothetical protein
MAIELTEASQELLRDIRVTLGSVGLSGDELVRGLKTFNSVFSASDGLLASNDTKVDNLSVLGRFVFNDAFFVTVSASDVRVAKDLTANELRIPGSSVFNDVNVTNDTLVQNLTVNGNFVSEAAKFYTPPTEAFIYYDSLLPEIFILTPSSINYTPKIIKTRGKIDFSDSLLQTNRTFEGNISLTKTDSTTLIVDGIDVLRGNISIANQTNLATFTLTGFKQVNNITVDLPLVREVRFPLLEAVLGGITITPRSTVDIGPLSSIQCPELKYIGTSLSIGGYAGIFGSDPRGLIANFRSINFNKLEFCPGISYRQIDKLQEFSFPLLETATSLLQIENCRDLENVKLPEFQQGASVRLANLPKLREFSLPKLQLRIGGYFDFFSGLNSLTGIYLPALEFYEPPYSNTFLGGCSALRKMNLGFDVLKTYGGDFNAEATNLDQATVTSLLSTFLRLDGALGTRLYSNNIFLSSHRISAPSYTGGTTQVANTNLFTKAGDVVTVNMNNHGYNTRDIVTFDPRTTDNFILSGFTGTYEVTATSLNQFTYSHNIWQSYSYTSSVPGEIIMYQTDNANDGFMFYQKIVLRNNLLFRLGGYGSTIVRVAFPYRD